MRSILIMCASLATTLSGVGRVSADPSYRRDVPAQLAAEAKVSEAAAVATAQRAVPTGTVVALELERERKVLMYSIDLKVPGASGVTEVEVDATNGKVIGSEHESGSDEHQEPQPR